MLDPGWGGPLVLALLFAQLDDFGDDLDDDVSGDVGGFDDDLARVARAGDALKRHRGAKGPLPQALLRAYAAALRGGAREVISKLGIASHTMRELPLLDAIVNRAVEPRARAAWGIEDHTRRNGALFEVMRWSTSHRAAEAVVARWLGARGVGVLMEEARDGDRLRRLGDVSWQVAATSSSALVRIDPASATLIGEAGGPGDGNGVIDAGEWIALAFDVDTASGAPGLFSASAFASTNDPCLWTDETEKHELEEMVGGEGSTVELWVYVGERCEDAHTAWITLRVRDSGRAGAERLNLGVRPYAIGEIELESTRFDTDDLGFSDGSRAERLRPNLRFEIASDVRIASPDVESAHMVLGIPKDASRLFTALAMRYIPMHRRAGAATFGAGDDLDAETAPASAFDRARASLNVSVPWIVRAQVLWIAADVEVVTAPGGERRARYLFRRYTPLPMEPLAKPRTDRRRQSRSLCLRKPPWSPPSSQRHRSTRSPISASPSGDARRSASLKTRCRASWRSARSTARGSR